MAAKRQPLRKKEDTQRVEEMCEFINKKIDARIDEIIADAWQEGEKLDFPTWYSRHGRRTE